MVYLNNCSLDVKQQLLTYSLISKSCSNFRIWSGSTGGKLSWKRIWGRETFVFVSKIMFILFYFPSFRMIVQSASSSSSLLEALDKYTLYNNKNIIYLNTPNLFFHIITPLLDAGVLKVYYYIFIILFLNSMSVTCNRSMVFSGYSSFLNQ